MKYLGHLRQFKMITPLFKLLFLIDSVEKLPLNGGMTFIRTSISLKWLLSNDIPCNFPLIHSVIIFKKA